MMESRRPYLRLKAASLVEVLVAMSLVSVMFVIGTMIWLQLNGPRAPFRELEFRLKAREILIGMEDFAGENGVIQDPTVYFVRETEPLNADQNLFQITVSCFQNNGELIFRRARIIQRHED